MLANDGMSNKPKEDRIVKFKDEPERGRSRKSRTIMGSLGVSKLTSSSSSPLTATKSTVSILKDPSKSKMKKTESREETATGKEPPLPAGASPSAEEKASGVALPAAASVSKKENKRKSALFSVEVTESIEDKKENETEVASNNQVKRQLPQQLSEQLTQQPIPMPESNPRLASTVFEPEKITELAVSPQEESGYDSDQTPRSSQNSSKDSDTNSPGSCHKEILEAAEHDEEDDLSEKDLSLESIITRNGALFPIHSRCHSLIELSSSSPKISLSPSILPEKPLFFPTKANGTSESKARSVKDIIQGIENNATTQYYQSPITVKKEVNKTDEEKLVTSPVEMEKTTANGLDVSVDERQIDCDVQATTAVPIQNNPEENSSSVPKSTSCVNNLLGQVSQQNNGTSNHESNNPPMLTRPEVANNQQQKSSDQSNITSVEVEWEKKFGQGPAAPRAGGSGCAIMMSNNNTVPSDSDDLDTLTEEDLIKPSQIPQKPSSTGGDAQGSSKPGSNTVLEKREFIVQKGPACPDDTIPTDHPGLVHSSSLSMTSSASGSVPMDFGESLPPTLTNLLNKQFR